MNTPANAGSTQPKRSTETDYRMSVFKRDYKPRHSTGALSRDRGGEPGMSRDLPWYDDSLNDGFDAAETAMLDAPLILDRYRPLELAGEGGFGTVQFAYDTRLQRRVAIKCLPLDADSPETTPGLTEARTAALLTHPNIVSVYDFATDGNYAYIIMECVDGPTLSEVIVEEGGLNLDEAACVVKAVGNALDFAHKNQVLHLDIKPDNILITPEGIVKVTDFGIAELAGSGGYGMARGGTIGYMAPEQMGTDPVDERTDVWAFAAVVYEMLSGTNPFRASDLTSSLTNIIGRLYDPVSCTRRDLDPEIDICLDAALSADPNERFSSARTFRNTIMEFLGDPDEGQQIFAAEIEPVEEDDEPRDTRGLWERLGNRGTGIIERILCALGCAWITWVVGTAVDISPTVLYAVMAAVGVGSLIIPALGTALTIIALAVGLFMMGHVLPGIAVVVLGGVWWALVGRVCRPGCAFAFLMPLANPLLLGPTVPLLAGFRLRPVHAVTSVALGSLLVLIGVIFTGGNTILPGSMVGTEGVSALLGTDAGESPVALASAFVPAASGSLTPEVLGANTGILLKTPGTWVIIAGWILSALLMAALCRRQTKMVSIIGSLAGCAIMALSIVASSYLASGQLWSTSEVLPLAQVGIAFVIICVITALGAPWHPEESPEEV